MLRNKSAPRLIEYLVALQERDVPDQVWEHGHELPQLVLGVHLHRGGGHALQVRLPGARFNHVFKCYDIAGNRK